ncbi:MAG TPA: hypothetical protein VG826_09910 [Pirellulales bacterium]|nr:hypothetical protein [Pirellulales bacterium]
MQRRFIICAVTMGLCLARAGLASGGVTLELDFANTSGAHLHFSGANGKFSFTPDSHGHDFVINNVSNGTGSAMGLFGAISGTFTISTIHNNAASVTGNGVLTIFDGSHNLTANISLVEMDKSISFGAFNLGEVVNLSNIHYTGSNQDLRDLAGGLDPTLMLSFFDRHTLAQLRSGGHSLDTGFAGAVTAAVPEPATMTFFLGASPVVGLWLARRRREKRATLA